MELIPESPLLRQEIGFVLLLSIAAVVAVVSRRVRLPYTVALVLAGLALSFQPSFLQVEVSSDLILALLVPPLVFEGALALPWPELRRNLAPILLLAVAGVIVGALVVATILHQALRFPLAAAFAFGALISATDPVAVIAFFRSLGVPKRLSVLVEGESLFNDGTAIVVFGLATSPAIASFLAGEAGLSLMGITTEFLRVAVGGLAVGALLGYVVSHVVLRGIDDHLIETAVTVALAFGSYLVAETLHVSGILAVVAAGLLVGNIGRQNTSPTTQVALDSFWEFLAFTANSMVFLIIGLEIHIVDYPPDLRAIVVAVAAVLASRFLVVYGLTWLHGRIEPSVSVPRPYRHVMYWGGLRGAISLALALTIGTTTFGADVGEDLLVMTFGVVLFTLLVQGTTIAPLIGRLGLAEAPPARLEQQQRQALVFAKREGKRELDRLHRDGWLSGRVWEAMAEVYDREIADASERLLAHVDEHAELELDMVLQAREAVLRAERGAIADAARRGWLSEEVHDRLVRETDRRAAALESIALGRARTEARWEDEAAGEDGR